MKRDWTEGSTDSALYPCLIYGYELATMLCTFPVDNSVDYSGASACEPLFARGVLKLAIFYAILLIQ